MLAFAGNSLLCRVALRARQIDAATFTALRIVSGALVLGLIVKARGGRSSGSAFSALALYGYAAAFSFAYLSLTAATGALLLFAAVQATMIISGLLRGERMRALQWLGVMIAFAGLLFLLLPGLSAPPVFGATLMLLAGIAWGVYSLHGKRGGDAIGTTAGNFIRSVPLSLLLLIAFARSLQITPAGLTCALISGAITSGLGYVLWYSVLPSLSATSAATVQLSAPVIAALGGILLLGEVMTGRLLVASLAVLGGIALVVLNPARAIARDA